MLKSVAWWVCAAALAAAGMTGAAFAQAPPPAAGAPAPDTPPNGDPCQPLPTPPAPLDAATDYPGGLSPVGSGLTPAKVPGAKTVTPLEAACLYNRSGGRLIILDATVDAEGLPGAYRAAFAAAGGSLADNTQKTFEEKLRSATGGDLEQPILVYCHHIRCFLSYNVALRAVQAGYAHVYWMREGIQGWLDWNLPVKPVRYFAGMEPPPPPSQEEMAARAEAGRRARLDELRLRISHCDQSQSLATAGDYGWRLITFRTLQESETEAARIIQKYVTSEQACLARARRDFEAMGAVELLPEVDQRVADTPARLRAAHDRGRIAFEENPLKFMADDDGMAPGKHRDLLALASRPLSLEEVCGRFDTSIPPVEDSAIAAFNARWNAYAGCVNTWGADKADNQGRLMMGRVAMQDDVLMLAAIRPYLCSGWKRPNCIPDLRWSNLAAVATAQNLERLKAAEGKVSNRADQIRRVSDVMHRTMDATKAAIAAHDN